MSSCPLTVDTQRRQNHDENKRRQLRIDPCVVGCLLSGGSQRRLRSRAAASVCCPLPRDFSRSHITTPRAFATPPSPVSRFDLLYIPTIIISGRNTFLKSRQIRLRFGCQRKFYYLSVYTIVAYAC